MMAENDELLRLEAEDKALDHNPRHTWLRVTHGENYSPGVLIGTYWTEDAADINVRKIGKRLPSDVCKINQ